MTHRGLDRFWDAAGSAPPLRLLVWHRGRSEPVESRLPAPCAVIGRCPPADLVLDHPQVSRRHAFVQLVGDRAYCVDLGSRSALGWDGRPRRAGWIEPGRSVEVGPFRIGLADPGPLGPRPAPSPDGLDGPPGSGPLLALEPAGESEPARRRKLVDRPFLTVGRAAECDWRLADLSISRYHCALIRLGAETWVVDLLGRGGVEVDARPERWAPLGDGSMLRLGRYLFTARLVMPRVAAGPAALPPPGGALGGPPALPGPPGPPATAGALALPAPLAPSDSSGLDARQRAELARMAEAMIAPMVDQLAAMQQQLYDQHHQSMMEMVAVFSRLHREHRGRVDRELRAIRRITREVRTLRRELERQRNADGLGRPGLVGHEDRPEPIRTASHPAPQGSPEDYRAAQARIIARMAELQQERQGRWQRLLGRLGAGVEPDPR